MTQLGTKKSRKGCTNCKKRRVKCNEQTPCANCTRRGEQCSLLGTACDKGDSTFADGLPRTKKEWIEDLELLQHYNHGTLSQPLGLRSDIQHVWRETVPREALKYPFLMHGILALSALHIAHERPLEADKYVRTCDKHRSQALEMFQVALCGDISPEFSTALFALSITISISSMARACVDALMMPEPRWIGVEQVAELFLLTRGVRDLISTCMDWVSLGPLSSMVDGYYLPPGCEVEMPLSLSVQNQFMNLRTMLEECCAEEYRHDCELALHHLEDTYRIALRMSTIDEVETRHIWRWMLLVPLEFIRMVQACFPPALIILAHFAAVSLTAPRTWYTNDWGSCVLTGISMTLYGTEMHEYLDWPVQHAHSHMTVLAPSLQHTVRHDSVMGYPTPPLAKVDFTDDRGLSLDPEIIEADLGFEGLVNF